MRRLGVVLLVLCLAAAAAPAPGGATSVGAASVGYPGCTIPVATKFRTSGNRVRCIQLALAAHGVPTHRIDGVFGVRTHLAIREFQRVNGLKVDGIVAAQTASLLGVWADTVPLPNVIHESRVIGYSVRGRPITARRLGTPGGKVVLAVGNSHGDEPGGLAITFYLRHRAVIPAGLDVWVIDTMNPDALAARTRLNSRSVDVNRNFSTADWARGGRGTRNYSGWGAGSEPETRAMMSFIRAIRPKVAVWWHQPDGVTDSQATAANPQLIADFATLTGLRLAPVPCGRTPCTGNASVYVNTRVAGATSFVVELPNRISLDNAATHAEAFLTISLRA